MVGKEAFEPDQIQVFGLDDKFPGDQVEWLEKQGLSRFWAEKYWIAHWTPPSLQLGFEMYHRGQLDDHELDLLFQLHEIPPFFRPKLKAISYRLLTRVDVRRMYRAGEIDAQKVFDTYKGSGYSNEDAQSMTNWVIAEYSPEQKELTRSQVERAYADGQLTESEAIQLLIQIGYTTEQAQWLTNNVELQEAKRLQDKVIDVIKTQYVNRLIDEVKARTALAEQEVSQARIDVYMLEWNLDIQLDVKLPSKTDVSKFYKSGIINKDQYRSFMRELGYDDELIGLYNNLDDQGKE